MIAFDLATLAPFMPQIALGLFLIACALIAWIIHLELRIHRLTRGKTGADLEDALSSIEGDMRSFGKFRTDMEEYLSDVERRVRKSVQGVSTVRFNAFEGTGEGGHQSFATAFLNEEGDGVVVSSIRARDRVGIYAKPVLSHTSEYELTEEEHAAIAKARIK
ncbi:MAG: DUF4446 family protein [Patescibacteria group bacterium]